MGLSCKFKRAPPLQLSRKSRDVLGERRPENARVDAVIDVGNEDPIGTDVVPRNFGHRGSNLVRQLASRVADPIDDRLGREPQEPVVVPGCLAASDDLGGGAGSIEQIPTILSVVRALLGSVTARARLLGCRRRDR